MSTFPTGEKFILDDEKRCVLKKKTCGKEKEKRAKLTLAKRSGLALPLPRQPYAVPWQQPACAATVTAATLCSATELKHDEF